MGPKKIPLRGAGPRKGKSETFLASYCGKTPVAAQQAQRGLRQVFWLTPPWTAFPLMGSGHWSKTSSGVYSGGTAPDSHGIPY